MLPVNLNRFFLPRHLIIFTALLLLLNVTIIQAGMQRAFSFSFSDPNSNSAMTFGFKDLRYGGSSGPDVQRILGAPDEIVHSQQMYPVVENYYYYADSGSGAATVFVFENGLLVGMHYKSPDNQYVDLTYFLIDNGDRLLNFPLNAGYQGYFPFFNHYTWY